MRKSQVEQGLQEIGAMWDTRDEKFVHPDDPFGSSPTWHIQPDPEHPHANNVLRFNTLAEVAEWIEECKAIQKAYQEGGQIAAEKKFEELRRWW